MGAAFTGPTIAELLGTRSTTVSAAVERGGIGRLERIGQEPMKLFGVNQPGEVMHPDVMKLGPYDAEHAVINRSRT